VAASSPVTLEVVAGGYETYRSTTTYEAGEHDVRASLRPALVMSPETTSPVVPSPAPSPSAPGSRAYTRSPLPGLLIAGAVTGLLALLSPGHSTPRRVEERIGIAHTVPNRIQNEIHPGEAATKDLYHLPPEEDKLIPTVCASLEEALEALDKDREFLTRGGVFSDSMIDAYLELKMQEVQRMRMTPHPVEFDMYYSS